MDAGQHLRKTRCSFRWHSTLRAATALLLAMCAHRALTHAQQIQETTTVLSSTTRLVVLDVIATTADGRPCLDLRAGDFTVLEDGIPQTIASFEAPVEQQAVRSKLNEASLPVPAARPESMRRSAATVIVLDELNTEFLDVAFARGKIRDLLRHSAKLAQTTALLALTDDGLVQLHDYTESGSELLASLDAHRTYMSTVLRRGGIYAASERLGKTLDAVDYIAASNTGYLGRKNVIWIGSGFPILNSPLVGTAESDKIRAAVHLTADLLMKARVTMYTVDARGMGTAMEYASGNGSTSISTGSVTPSRRLVFERLAPETGGRIFRGRNDLDISIREAMDDGTHYYTVSYYPSNHEWNGELRRTAVQIARKGVTVRTRMGYYATAERVASDDDIGMDLSRTVSSPLAFRGVDMRVQTTRQSGRLSDPLKLKLLVAPLSLTWSPQRDGRLRAEVSVVVARLTRSNALLGHEVRQMEVFVHPGRLRSKNPNPVVLEASAKTSNSSEIVRVVVRDMSSGRTGSVDVR